MNAEGAGLVMWNVGLEILRIWTQAEIVSVTMPIPSHLLIHSLEKATQYLNTVHYCRPATSPLAKIIVFLRLSQNIHFTINMLVRIPSRLPLANIGS